MTTDDNRLTMPGKIARELAYQSAGEAAYMGYKIVSNELIDTGRWETIHDLVIVDDVPLCDVASYWKITYSKGATEYQSAGPFEDQDQVTFVRVVPKTVTVTTYERVAD